MKGPQDTASPDEQFPFTMGSLLGRKGSDRIRDGSSVTTDIVVIVCLCCTAIILITPPTSTCAARPICLGIILPTSPRANFLMPTRALDSDGYTFHVTTAALPPSLENGSNVPEVGGGEANVAVDGMCCVELKR